MAKTYYILGALVLFAFLSKPYFVSGDDGSNIALARSLHEGRYNAINEITEPAQSWHPPLYPLLLFPVANQPAGNAAVVRLWAAAISFFVLIPVAAAARRRDPALGILGALPFAVSPLFGEFSTSILSETAFVALCYFVVTRLDAVCSDQNSGASFWPAAAAVPAALLLNTAGSALLVSVGLFLIWKKRWKELAGVVIVTILVLSPWWLWQIRHGGDQNIDTGYLTLSELFTRRAAFNSPGYVGPFAADAILPPFMRDIAAGTSLVPVKIAISGMLALFCVAGFIRRVRSSGVRIEEIFVSIAAAMLIFHSVFADRYLYFILPSLFGYLFYGISSLTLRRKFAVFFSTVLLVGSVLSIETDLSREDLAYIECIEWISEHAAPGDVIVGRKPTAVWFYTGLKSEGYPPAAAVTQWLAKYIILDDYSVGVPSAGIFADRILANATHFRPVYESRLIPGVKIFEVIP